MVLHFKSADQDFQANRAQKYARKYPKFILVAWASVAECFRANPSPIGITVALQFKKYSCDHQRIADRTISAITDLSDLAAITDLWTPRCEERLRTLCAHERAHSPGPPTPAVRPRKHAEMWC